MVLTPSAPFAETHCTHPHPTLPHRGGGLVLEPCLPGRFPLFTRPSEPPGPRHAMAAHYAMLRGRSPWLRCEMPKLKTKPGAKKRFKITATGKLKAGVAGKRHRLISHSAKYIRQNRGTKVMSEADAKIIRSFLPYG